MKTTHITLLLISIATVIASCKKDNEEEPVTYANYAQLKVGNYWIYRHFTIDTLGNETATNTYDSCYVEKDTIINGLVYFKTYRPSIIPNLEYAYLRDSLHYVVDAGGKIVFSSQDFISVFEERHITAGNDTIAYVYKKMADKDMIISVPAGIVQTSNFQETYNMYPGWDQNGDPRYINIRYAENVGIVSETLPFFSSQPEYTERRLVRFHLN